jgi:hypothetical protein
VQEEADESDALNTPNAAGRGDGAPPSGASTPWSHPSSASTPPQPAAATYDGFNMSRERQRDLVYGPRGGSAPPKAGSATNLAAMHTDEEGAPAGVSARVSHAGRVSRVSGLSKISGFDARAPNDRASRASNVLTVLNAISGGQHATFLFEQEDKRTRDAHAAARAAARASAAEAASNLAVLPTRRSSHTRHSRGRGTTMSGDVSLITSTPPPDAGSRCRSHSSPQQMSRAQLASHSAGPPSPLAGITEGGGSPPRDVTGFM